MRGHVDAESLALCAEGLLGRRRSGRIRSHVASCPRCAATQARLAEVPALLAQVPPSHMPPGIAARLDAALSAETARRAARDPGTVPAARTVPAAGTVPDDTVPAQRPATMPIPRTAAPRTTGPRAGRPRGPRLRLPVSARVLATAGVLVAAGGVGYAVAQSSPSPTSSSSAGSEAAPSRPSANSAIRSPPSGIAPATAPGGSVQFTVRRSGKSYGKNTFAAQAAALLNAPSAGLIRPGKAGGGLSLHASRSALVQCVEQVAGAPAVQARKVDMVDEARYRGHPATIIVVAATSTRPAMVYVAGPRCSASGGDILAKAPLPASG
jgi:hypothetical protein